MKKIFFILMILGFFMFLHSENEIPNLDDNWVTISEHQGANGGVSSIKYYEDYIYIGGGFSAIKGILANSVARLNLQTGVWSTLGSGLNGGVVSLSIVNSDKIFAAGNFKLEDDDHYYDGVYMWNGENWEEISLEFDGDIFSTAINKDGNLYVAGEFSNVGDVAAENIVMWDGEKWSSLEAGLNYEVRNIMFDNDGNLLAVGGFSGSGDDYSISDLAKWDGKKWHSFPIDPFTSLYTAAIGRDGNLYAAGNFVESETYIKVAKWDGSKWNPLGEGSIGDFSGNIITLEVDEKGIVYAGGYFDKIGEIEVGGISKWDGEKWHSLDKGVDHTPVESILPVGDDVYIGGFMFQQAGNVVSEGIARWDGNKWNSIGNGIGNGYYQKEVNTVEIDSNGNVLVGGNFRVGGCCYDEDDIYFAVFDGKKWDFPDSGLNGTVNAIVSDQNGNVYLGGNFTEAGGKEANHVAKWNEKNWSSLGSGTDGDVRTLALDKEGNLYAGGIKAAGGVEVYGVAKWNGEKWSALDSNFQGSVYSLYSDKKGNIYAGGCFHKENVLGIYYIAKWNGEKWSQIGPEMDECIDALAVDENGVVYISSEHFYSEGINLGSIVKLDGNEWKPLGSGLKGSDIYAIKPDGRGNVYVGGSISIEEEKIKNIAKWDGKSWHALGSGVSGGYDDLYSIDIDSEGNLYVGGRFIQAGNKYSNLVAKYVSPEDENGSNSSEDENSSNSGCALLFF